MESRWRLIEPEPEPSGKRRLLVREAFTFSNYQIHQDESPRATLCWCLVTKISHAILQRFKVNTLELMFVIKRVVVDINTVR